MGEWKKPSHFPVPGDLSLVFPYFCNDLIPFLHPTDNHRVSYLPETVLGSFFHPCLSDTYLSPGQILGA